MEYMNLYKSVAEQFCLEGEVMEICPYGEGHINLTLLVTTTKKRYIMQKMNTRVFSNPDGLMANICGVTEHLQSRGIETLRVVPTKTGENYLKAEECFRVYDFIEDTVTYQTVTDKEVFKNSGEAFGKFQNYLSEFDASKLSETIKRFHDTPNRFENFKAALTADAFGRAKECQEEIERVLRIYLYSKVDENEEKIFKQELKGLIEAKGFIEQRKQQEAEERRAKRERAKYNLR